MSSDAYFMFHRLLDSDRRLGTAILASAVLHALTLLSLSGPPLHGDVLIRAGYPALSVRIERSAKSPEPAAMVVRDKKISFHQKPAATKAVEISAPADIETSLSQPGVSVSDTLYLRPIPGRASTPLLATGEFRRDSEISEKPEMVAIRVPKYPRPAQEQKVSGWVVVMLLVDEHGTVVEAAAVESSESFGEYGKEVAEGLNGSTLTPGKVEGKAVKTIVFATVKFDPRPLPGPETIKSPGAAALSENKNER